MEISIDVLLRTLFTWHTSDNVPSVSDGVDSFQVFKSVILKCKIEFKGSYQR